MTTPAINTNQRLFIQGHYRYIQNGKPGPTMTYGSGSEVGIKRESRPASISRLKTASGWRTPTAWNHSGLNLSASGRRFTYSPYVGSEVVWEYFDDAGWTNWSWNLPGVPQYLVDRAVNKALSRLESKIPNVDLATNFGERRDAARMMEDRLRGIAKTVTEFRHLNPKHWGQVVRNGAVNELRNIPGTWLEVQYGWKPLMSDIHSACAALNKRESDQDSYRAGVKGVGRDTSVQVIRPIRNSVTGFATIDIPALIESTAVCRLDYELDNPFIQSLASMGVTNPLNLVWELLPYSFVVDWALPVGNYLELLDADFGWKFMAGSITRYQRAKGTGRPISSDSRRCFNLDGRVTFSQYSMTRVLLSSSPWPRLPHLKNPLSLGHVANALSLLVQAFK